MPCESIQFNGERLCIRDENTTSAYQACDDLIIELNHGGLTDYRRELGLGRAVHPVRYFSAGGRHRLQAFASHPAGLEPGSGCTGRRGTAFNHAET
ncbi:hypothetical protein IMCC26134_12345 [Verrucomicrobia bacterium IMCC26134]|nr:hypothetical protein IMCC26134_12345 [Verrucomicrobia bacterium IMCC26134]